MDNRDSGRENPTPGVPDLPQSDGPEPEFKGWKERLYDKVPLSVHALDIIIKVLIAAIVVCILLGMLKTRMGG